jgi:adenine phosphoribosyltransferase
MENLRKLIREVPDFPKPGINFYDITTLLLDPEGLESTIDALTEQCRGKNIDTVIGIESRGFIFGAPLAYQLGVGFIPVRKPGKLPSDCVAVEYELEYGIDTLEMHEDAVGAGHNILIVDDLLATGGTARAVVDLVEGVGGNVAGLLFVIELNFLNGRQKFDGYDVQSLIKYDS